MKIHHQFIIFVAGVLLLPLCILIAISLVSYYNRPELLMVPGYQEVGQFVRSEVSEQGWQDVTRRLKRNPSSTQVAILSPTLHVYYSTIPQIPEDTVLTEPELLQFIRYTGDNYLYQLESSPNHVKDGLFVLMRTPRGTLDRVSLKRSFFSVFLIVLAAVAVFCSFVTSSIARSITKSVTSLEEATARIAGGNLDAEVSVSGSTEFASLATSLNTMRLALKEDRLRQSRFIMGISHDLRTPVALIKGYTESIADGFADDPETLQKSLGIISQKTTQLEELIDELINFVKLGTEDWRATITEHNITPFLQEYARRIETDGTLLKREVQTSVTLPGTLLVKYDEKLFLRVLENLTGNAMRYTQEGGVVRFSAALEGAALPVAALSAGALPAGAGTSLAVTIADTGCGIAESDLPYIFDPFFRGSASRREDGKGLGLAVVKSIVDSHGWSIAVNSALHNAAHPGMSTVFTLTIPLGASL